MKAAVREGRFRSDLYHRLSQIPICVPPLRDRRDDIAPLALHYLAQQGPGLHFSEAVLEKLSGFTALARQYLAELRNVVMRAAVLAEGPEITVADLPEEFLRSSFSAGLQQFAGLSDLEKTAILAALEESQGHQQKAADKLGISKRTLQRKIRSYGMTTERVSAAG